MIKALNNRLFIIVLMFLTISLTFLQCEDLEDDGLYNGTVLDYHIERSNAALNVWEIGLSTGNTAISRSTESGYQYNPVNWIVATNDSCIGEGIPSSFKSECPFFDSLVIGLCSVRYYTSGAGLIVDTTVMIYKDFQEDEAIAEEEQQSIYSHELGHCLGLSHTNQWAPLGDDNYIMYPNTDGNNTPHNYELNAIKSVYGTEPTLYPSGGEGGRDYAEYFIRNSGTDNPIRHEHLPIFYIYPYDPLSVGFMFSQQSLMVEPGKKLKENPMTANFYYHSNGDLIEEYIDKEGRIEHRRYIEAHSAHH